MKAVGIIAKVPKKPHYYPSGKQRPNIPNQLNRQFNPSQANTHWVGDITYIRHHGSWSYLMTVLDLGSWEIVGYALSQTPDAQLARQALLNAIKMQAPDTLQLIFINHQSVVSAVEHYIRYYNNKRIHSSIGNMTPVQKKQILLNVA
jgi:putative transposase